MCKESEALMRELPCMDIMFAADQVQIGITIIQ